MRNISLIKLAVCLILLLCLSKQQICGAQPSFNDLLQSGNIDVSNSLYSSSSQISYSAAAQRRVHIYDVVINYNVPSSGFQSALSTGVFNWGSSINYGVDYSVRAGASTNLQKMSIVLLMNEDNAWINIRINYLISSRSDFFLGFLIQDTYILFNQGTQAAFSSNLNNWVSSSNSFTVIALLSGVKTSSQTLNVALSSVSFTPTTGILQVSASSSSIPPVQNIQITYIIISSSSSFTYTSFNPASGSTASYQIIGVNSFQNKQTSLEGYSFGSNLGLLNCIGANCPSSCVSSQTCLNYNGNVFGGSCYICSQGQVFSNGNCISSNQCGPNMNYNGQACVCNFNYILVNNICYIACGPNAYINNSVCNCLPGYTFSPATGQCQLSIACPANSQSVNGQCVCNNGYQFNNNGVCVPVSCGIWQILVNNVCTCIGGLTMVNGNCVSNPCTSNQVRVNGQCVCANGYGFVNNICVLCPTNSYISASGACVCNANYQLNTQTITCDSSCFANSYPDSNGNCVCKNGYYRQGLQCIANPNCGGGNMVWNGQFCVCAANTYQDIFSNSCLICNTPDRSISGSNCICASTYYPSSNGGICVPCTPLSTFNASQAKCVCNTGYAMNSNGLCVQVVICPANSQYNTITLACVCTIPGQYLNNGICSSCPLNSTLVGSSCVCNNGFQYVGSICVLCDPNSAYNSAQGTCICNKGYYGNYLLCNKCDATCLTCSGPGPASCLSCPTQYTFINGLCNLNGCPNYFFNLNNVCTPCPTHCITCNSINVCSTCDTGYVQNPQVSNGQITVNCVLNPGPSTSSTLSLLGTVQGNSVVFQGAKLSTIPTALLASNCALCDQILTVNTVSASAVATTSVAFVSGSRYSFLIEFDFLNSAFIPTFSFTVQINTNFASYFTAADMAQLLTLQITPQASSLTSTTTFSFNSNTAALNLNSNQNANNAAASLKILNKQDLDKILGGR